MNAANDEVNTDAVPDRRCGSCGYWGEYVHSGRTTMPLGLCFVRPGELPVYTAPTVECTVRLANVRLWKPVRGSA